MKILERFAREFKTSKDKFKKIILNRIKADIKKHLPGNASNRRIECFLKVGTASVSKNIVYILKNCQDLNFKFIEDAIKELFSDRRKIFIEISLVEFGMELRRVYRITNWSSNPGVIFKNHSFHKIIHRYEGKDEDLTKR